MRAVIILVNTELEGRFERALPPEHRIRARRPTADHPNVAEFIVEGPMLPEVVGDCFQRADLQLSMHSFSDEGVICVEACWSFHTPSSVAVSECWQVGEWNTLAEMMEFLR